MELLEAVLEGANVEVDEAADERKGGAGKIGKMFFSSGVNQLAMICHVPKELAEKLTLAGARLGRRLFDQGCLKPNRCRFSRGISLSKRAPACT